MVTSYLLRCQGSWTTYQIIYCGNGLNKPWSISLPTFSSAGIFHSKFIKLHILATSTVLTVSKSILNLSTTFQSHGFNVTKIGHRRVNSTEKTCFGQMAVYAEVPKIIILEYPYCNTKTSHKVKFVVNGEEVLLSLRGIIYHGDNHFTSRVFSSEGKVWFHDGITTKNKCIDDG